MGFGANVLTSLNLIKWQEYRHLSYRAVLRTEKKSEDLKENAPYTEEEAQGSVLGCSHLHFLD